MREVLFDQVVFTDYGQFDLTWDDEDFGFDGHDDRYFAGQVNGLVGAASGTGVYIGLGRRSGGSRVQIVLLEQQPPLPGVEFEDVVEVSITVPADATVAWSSWAGETHGPLVGIGGGTYRLRVSARGRDAGRANEVAPDVVDEYVVELWPAPFEDDRILRVESKDGQYWHGEWGGRR